MRAVAVRRDETEPAVIETPRPEPTEGEVLVRTLRVGVDGTDREVIAGDHGGFPPGADHLVLGHEAVGEVIEPAGRFAAGDVVVPTVRRPPPGEPNDYFRRNQQDMAPPEATLERGIDGAHGFMAEYLRSDPQYLIDLPAALADRGFLIEPLSVIEKALAHARATRSAFDWRPETAVVIGNGSLGLLAVAALAGGHTEPAFERTYCVGRRDRPDPTIDLIESLGATYVDSRSEPVEELAQRHEPMDLAIEATGVARHPFEAIHALASGGVAALLGIPDAWRFEIDGGAIHEELVMHNKAVVGSVNAATAHFEAAVETLAALPDSFLESFVTGVHPISAFQEAFCDDRGCIKQAVQLGER